MRALGISLLTAASVLLVAPAQASAPITAPSGLFNNVAQIDRSQIDVRTPDTGYLLGVAAWLSMTT